MKRIVFLFFAACLCFESSAQQWSQEQLVAANTGKSVTGITDVEREAIQYINLARLYPQQFSRQEVARYAVADQDGNKNTYAIYAGTLVTDLEKRQPVTALKFDRAMYDLAACFALESGTCGTTGHTRLHCKGGYLGECCSYGMNTGRSIALQWLVDEGITSLGHRTICLDGAYHVVGLAFHEHKAYRFCAVADFK